MLETIFVCVTIALVVFLLTTAKVTININHVHKVEAPPEGFRPIDASDVEEHKEDAVTFDDILANVQEFIGGGNEQE